MLVMHTAPPTTTSTSEYHVAARLRQLRLEKGLTMSALAGKSGLSQAYLSRVESHKASITLASLDRLAAALGVPVSIFFDGQAERIPISVFRSSGAKDRHPRHLSKCQAPFWMMAEDKKGKMMEPFIVEIPTATAESTHLGEEFNYIVQGSCLMRYGKQLIELHQGDAVYFDSSIGHSIKSTGREPLRILAVVTSRDYLFHGDLTKFLQSGNRANLGS
jgi:transcriptional regulator with XRE-family HTH domain